MATEAGAAAGATSAAYEEERRKRVLENLKHLEELGISKISKSLLQVARLQSKNTRASPKLRKKFEATEVRRSSRAKNSISYRDDLAKLLQLDQEEKKLVFFDGLDLRLHRRRYCKSADNGREYTGRVASYEQQVRAFKRAEKLQDGLNDNPSFVKTMVRSHVSSCFWLGLPSSFCKKYLPPREHRMVLEDEEGLEFDAVYIGNRTGLSGGWRGFAMHHNLEDGDSLVFELSNPDRFKIYILKAIDPETEASDEKIADENTREITEPAKEEPDPKDSPVSEQPCDAEPLKGAPRRKRRARSTK